MKFNSNREGASFRSLLCTPTAAAVDSDPTNQAVQLTAASTQYLSIADNSTFSVGDRDWSFCVWVRADSLGADRTIISKADSFVGGVIEYWLFYDNGLGRFRLWVYNAAGTRIGDVVANTFGAPSTATWYFIECGHNAAADQVWISVNGGTRDTAATGGGIPFDGTSTFKIGANTTGNTEKWDGRIDSVGFYSNYALSTTDRDTLYNGGAGKKKSQLSGNTLTNASAWYDFAAGAITTDGISSNTLTNNNGATNAAGITT